MNLEQMRARIAAIAARLQEIKAVDGNFTDEQVKEATDLNTEFGSLKTNIETQELIESVQAQASASVGRVVLPKKIENKAALEPGDEGFTRDPKGGYKSQGEFLLSVVKAKTTGTPDKRLLAAGAKESVGEDGGFLIPADYRSAIQDKVKGDDSLLKLTTQLVTESNSIVMPTSEVAPWDGTGIQAYWEGEAGSITGSKHKFGETTLKLHKLTALVRVTEELLNDASALESYIKNQAPMAIVQKVNSAIIAGSGAGQPQGFLNSAFKVKVSKVGSQTADTVWFANVNSMHGSLIPMSQPKAVWLVHPAVLPQLPLMKFDQAATSGVPVYLPATGVSGAPYGTLYGRPILPMLGGVKAIGDEGDINLVDLSYYLTAVKSAGVRADMSTHIYFDTDEIAFKFVMRVAGQCPFKAPVTPENGTFPMSAFITLEAR